jgi:DNA-binding SARP family transcriptional activator
MDQRDPSAAGSPLLGAPGRGLSLDIRLLGSVRATAADGRTINLGGPMQRLVLVQLALRAGEVVSTESLIDVLWGESPPPTARRSLQAHVAKLRAALGAEDGPLSSRGRGYVLEVARSDVDVLRIEDGLRSVRESMAADPVRATDLITDCRADWTGPPFDDLASHETLDPERERLMRLRDELDDAEADLRVALGDTATTVPQLERAVVEDPTHEPHWVRLITAYYASGRQRDALDAYRRASQTMLDELGVDPSPQLQQLEVQILRQEITVADGREACPYKGLASYQIADGASFFGRSESIDELVNLVLSTPIGVVVGPSGVGKSSVLRAGLAHRILTGQVPGMATVAVMTPGLQPLRSLYAAAHAVDVIVVDQFEELFTLTDEARRRDEFVDELLAMAGPNGSRVVIAVRADFYGHCLTLQGLARVLGRHQVNIGAMSAAGLREAIEGPATAAGLETEPALLEALIDEVTDHPGALPLLSHALSETWRRRSGATLTLAGYREAGSIAGAISATAERLHGGLDSDGRRQLERLFLRLVEPGSGTAHTRRATDRTELDSAGFDAALIDRLVEARLLTATTEEVEIAHEALFSAWPRLGEWIDGERDNLMARQRLTRATTAWLASDRDEADLYRGNRLAAALAWRAESSAAPSEDEDEFLRVSEDRAQDELARQRRTNRRLRVLAAVSVVAMVAALSATFVAVGRSRDADRRREQVETNQLASVVAADTSLTRTERLRAAAALQGHLSTPETDSLLLASILASPDVVSVADLDIFAVTGDAPMHASGHALLVTGQDGRPAVLDGIELEFGAPITDFRPELVRRSGDRLFGVHPDTFEVIDLASSGAFGPPPPLDGEPSAAALSEEAALLAIGYDGRDDASAHIEVIDVVEGRRLGHLELDGRMVRDLEFDPTRARLIATVDNTALELWDVAELLELAREAAPTRGRRLLRTNVDPATTERVRTSAFDGSGGAVALGRQDGAVEVWREADGQWGLTATKLVHEAAVSWIEFGADDGLIVSSAVDGSVAILDAYDGSTVFGPVEFDAAGAFATFFVPATDDELISIAAGTAWRWSSRLGGGLVEFVDVASGAPLPGDGQEWFGVVDRSVAAVDRASVSARDLDRGVIDVVNGRSGNFVVVYADRLEWRRGDELIASIPGVRGEQLEGRIAVTDGRIAILGERSNERQGILVLDAAGETVDDIWVHGTRADVARIDLDETGTQLVFSTANGELVWYSLDGFDAAELLPIDEGYGGHFLGADRVVAVGAEGVHLIDTESGERVAFPSVGRGAIDVAFDDDRGIVATMDPSGAVAVWHVDSGTQIGPSFSPIADALGPWIAFDGAGRLVVGGSTGSAVLTLDADEWRDHACQLVQASDPGAALPTELESKGLHSCS